MIGNDTYALSLDSGYLHGAALALHAYLPNPRTRTDKLIQRRLDTGSASYRLAASVTNLRLAVEQARTALRMGRADLALAALEAV